MGHSFIYLHHPHSCALWNGTSYFMMQIIVHINCLKIICIYSFQQGTLSNTPVITVIINDRDIPSSNNLEFFIVSGDPDGIFTIDSNGEIRQTSQLDREIQAFYNLTILVRDNSYDRSYEVSVCFNEWYSAFNHDLNIFSIYIWHKTSKALLMKFSFLSFKKEKRKGK